MPLIECSQYLVSPEKATAEIVFEGMLVNRAGPQFSRGPIQELQSRHDKSHLVKDWDLRLMVLSADGD